LGDEWGFTLYDAHDREIVAFCFHTEAEARQAHKMMDHVVHHAIAISPAEGASVAVPFLKLRPAA
jgi:hypothetical protein